MPKSGARKVVKPVAAAAVTLGTIASIWWFALKPRRKAKDAGITDREEVGRPAVGHPAGGSPSTSAGRHSLIEPLDDDVGQGVHLRRCRR